MQIQVRLCRYLDSVAATVTQGRRAWVVLPCLLLVAASVHLFSLLRYPSPFVDEAWIACRTYSLLRNGIAFGTLDAGVVDRFEGYWTTYPWLLPRLQSVAVRALGLSLFSVRLVSLVFGLILLAALPAIGKGLGDGPIGLVAAALASVSLAFFQSAHLARYDIIAAALGYSAIALYVTDNAPSLSPRAALSGLILGLAFEIHPNAAIYGPAIVALHFLQKGRRALRSARLWSFGAGVCVGLAFYVVVHILPYPQTYAAVNRLAFGPTHTPPLLTGSPSLWLQSLLDTGLLALLADGLLAPLTLGGIAILILGRSEPDTRFLVLTGTLLLAFASLVRNKATYYAIFFTPALNLLAAAFLLRLWRRRRRVACEAGRPVRVMHGILLAVSCLVVLAAAAGGLRMVRDDPMPDYNAVVQRVRQTVPQDRSIMASQTYWFGMPDQPYYSWEALPVYLHYAPGSTLDDAFAALRPDYLVIDAHMAYSIVTDKTGLDPYYEYIAIEKADLHRFLDEQADLVSRFQTETFGDIRIYRINWD